MPQAEMTAIRVELPDGSTREVAPGTTFLQLAEGIAAGLARRAVGALVTPADGGEPRIYDLKQAIPGPSKVKLLVADDADKDSVDVLRHSTAHLMAQAVTRLFPKALMTIGPVTEDGFFYDFDIDQPFSTEDLARIEDEMKRLAKEDASIDRHEIPSAEIRGAIEKFRTGGEPYKAEILEDIHTKRPEEAVSYYTQGHGFSDLCRGPHLPATGFIKHVKLLSVAGAYWRGSEKNKMLQRIYGTAYFKAEALEAHLHRIEEAARRDHRKLGKELDLFSIPQPTGPGLIFWHPKGATVRAQLENWLRGELLKRGYSPVYTPHVVKETLFEISGHLQTYAENMYPPMELEGENYRVKPMNCPGHNMIYKSQPRSYRDLPLRFSEFASVYRFERSGTLHGLARVRGLTQDDAHIYCREDQLTDEIVACVDFVQEGMRIFGLEADVYLSTRPEKAIGSEEIWDKAIAALREALERKGMAYKVDEGGGAFYGPKIDFKFHDAIGREWQGPTVQCDFNLPERFDLTYKGSDGQEHRPIMVHRAVLGTFERFMALIIEHFAGAFPLWLAPVQLAVLPIAIDHQPYAAKVRDALVEAGFRVELDDRNESLNYRIRAQQLAKVPYMLVVGAKEAEAGSVAIRSRSGGQQEVVPLADAVRRFADEVSRKG